MNKEEKFAIISYSHKDEVVNSFIDVLLSNGCHLWYDKNQEGGAEWLREIPKKIRECEVFVAFLSKNFYESLHCPQEMAMAAGRGKDMIAIALEPLDFDAMPADIEYMVRKLDVLQYEDRMGYTGFCKELFKKLNKYEITENVSLPWQNKEALAKAQVRRDHEKEQYSHHYNIIELDEKRFRVPYRELFGSAKKGEAEFIENENLICSFTEDCYDLSAAIVDYKGKLKKEQERSVQSGFMPESYPKLCLGAIKELKDAGRPGVSVLEAEFGQTDYFGHRILREEFANRSESTEQWLKNYERAVSFGRGNNPYLKKCPWAMCGGGAWVITSDDYIIFSKRVAVVEEQNKISYSASGGYDRYYAEAGGNALSGEDSTPLMAIRKEMEEELGLPQKILDTARIKLINLGIDIQRYLIQFSYYVEITASAWDVLAYRANAQTADEQELIFLPFEPSPILEVLRDYEMEAGAAFSLYRLLQKNFLI